MIHTDEEVDSEAFKWLMNPLLHREFQLSALAWVYHTDGNLEKGEIFKEIAHTSLGSPQHWHPLEKGEGVL